MRARRGWRTPARALRSRIAGASRLATAAWLAVALVPGVVALMALSGVATGGPSIAAPISLSPNCQQTLGELPNLCPSTPTNASDGTHHPHLSVRKDGSRRYHFDSVIWNAGGAFQIEGTDCDDEGCSTVDQRIFEDDGIPGGASRTEPVVGGQLIVETGDGHDHYHYENATLYELIRPSQPSVPIAKIGFCMLDTFENRNGPIPTSYFPSGSGTCSRRSGTVVMGISTGWGDYYSVSLALQWIVVTDVEAGEYTLRSTVNPGNEFIEANYDDNVLEETREIPGATAADVIVSAPAAEQVTVELSGTVEGRFVDVLFEDGPAYNSGGPALGFEIVDGPENGGLSSIDRTGNTTAEITYTADGGFSGTDTFTYRTIDDRGLDSLLATVTVVLEGPPAPPAPPPPSGPPEPPPPPPVLPAPPPPPEAPPPPPPVSGPSSTTPGPKVPRQTMVGTKLGDFLEGSVRHELFRGRAGPDEILGLGGHDVAYGNRGRDSMKLGNGQDVGLGGKGKDVVMLGNGNDIGYGGRGSDLLVGGNGRDTLYGGRGGDTLMIRDGKPDVADCGLGLDTVIADLRDTIDESCEIVELPPDPDALAPDGAGPPDAASGSPVA